MVASDDDLGGSYVNAHRDVEAARELDREGVRSFREGRYVDAVRYFRAAYRLGGPPSELWNVARSHERRDDAEHAAQALDVYLSQPNLSPEDRADAERELRALRTRVSVLTVTTTPPGASLTIDSRAVAGVTPLSVEVPTGGHVIAVHRNGYALQSVSVDACLGRAVIVSLDLARPAK